MARRKEGRRAGGGMSTAAVEREEPTEKIQTLYEGEDTVYSFILADQPQTVSLYLDVTAPA